MKNKLLTLFLALAASVVTLFAQSGTCGDNLTWTLSGGTLTISGTGAMTSYTHDSYSDQSNTPWSSYRESITSVIISDGVTSIGNCAFYYCRSLTSVTIPNSVTSIGNEAFWYCSSLTSVTIPNSVTSIGYSAFENCSSLTSINIPNSVTSIRDYAFRRCSSLTSITIPNSVTSIGFSAFSGCSNLTSITIPNSVTRILDSAFSGCSNLTSITIPNSVIRIGDSPFPGCDGLTSINVDAANSAYCDINGVLFSKDKTTLIQYPAGKTATSYTIPNSVTSIGIWAFSGCTGLTSITIPNSVTSIGEGAFSGCSSLTSINIPNSVTSIGEGAFSYCNSLTSITIPNSVTSIGQFAFSNCRNLTSITIPNSVTSIGDHAFDDCSGLTSITIGNSVTSIGDYAFYNCSSLTSVTIPNSVTSIGGYAFSYCSSLTSVIIGNGVTSIGIGAFFRCASLSEISIPESVASIGTGGTFQKCTGLTTVHWNAKNCTIESYDGDGNYYWPFYDLQNITTFTFGQNVETIPAYLCSGLSRLTSITIPANVKNIEYYAFYNCSSLTSITCYCPNPPMVNTNTFDGVSTSAKLYVLANSYESYKNHEIWGQFDVQKINGTDVGNGDDNDPTGNNNDNTPQIVTIYQDCSLNPVVPQDNPHDVLSNLRFTRASVSYSYNQTTHQPTEVVSDTFDIFTVTTTGESVKGCIITATINLFSEGFGYNDDAELSGPNTGYIMSMPGYIAYADYGMNPNLSDGNQGKIFTKPEDHIVKPAGLWKTSDEIDSNTMIAGRVKNEASYLAHVKTAVDAVATEDWDTWGTELLNALDEGLSGGMLWEYNYSESWGDYAPTYIPTALVTSVIVQIEKGNDTYMYNINGLKATIKPLKLTNIGDDFYIPLGVTTQLDGNGNRVVTSNYIEFEEEINYLSTTKNASFVSPRERNIPSIEIAELKKLINRQFNTPVLPDKSINLQLPKSRRNLPATDKSVIVLKSEGCDSYAEAYVESGSTVNIKAVPMDGYTFSHWSDGNTDNPRTLTITNDVTYTALFESVENATTYTITWQDEDGNVIKTDKVENATIPAYTGTTPTKEGYDFVGWLPNIKPATKDICYTTYFIPLTQAEEKVYTVNINGENCSLNINNQYPEGTVITLEAVADECFEFRQWSDGNKDNPRTVTVTKDMNLTAEFNKLRYTVTGQTEAGAGGKVQIIKK